MQIHQPHHAGPARLERQRIDFVRLLRAILIETRPPGQRLGRIRQREAALDDGADAIDGMEEIAGLDAVGTGGGKREHAGGVEDAIEGCAGREHAQPGVPGARAGARASATRFAA